MDISNTETLDSNILVLCLEEEIGVRQLPRNETNTPWECIQSSSLTRSDFQQSEVSLEASLKSLFQKWVSTCACTRALIFNAAHSLLVIFS